MLGSAFHHSLSAVRNPKLFNKFIKVSVHNGWKIVLAKTNAVIRNSALWIIIGPDLLRPVSRSYY